MLGHCIIIFLSCAEAIYPLKPKDSLHLPPKWDLENMPYKGKRALTRFSFLVKFQCNTCPHWRQKKKIYLDLLRKKIYSILKTYMLISVPLTFWSILWSLQQRELSVRITTHESGWNKDFSFHYAERTKLPKTLRSDTMRGYWLHVWV